MFPAIKNLEDLLKGHINGPILDTTVTRLTAPGENYGSLMLKLDIKVKNRAPKRVFLQKPHSVIFCRLQYFLCEGSKNGAKEEIFHAVAKCLPLNKEVQKLFNIQITFKNELRWYTTVIPTMIDFVKEQKADIDTDIFMQVYGARLSLDPKSDTVDDGAVIVCENLVQRGYKNVNRQEGFDYEQTKELLKKLATFHAITLALKLKRPELFKTNVKQYLHVLEQKQERTAMDFFKPIVAFLKGHPDTAPLMPRVIKTLEVPPGENNEVSEPWATAIHTDFWVNNMMLKETPGSPPKVIILDLQICSYGSAVDDLLFFLFTSVQTDLVEKRFDKFLKLYHTELTKNLTKLNVDAALFSIESFENELKARAPAQLGHCLFFIGMILSENSKNFDPLSDDFKPDSSLDAIIEAITDKQEKKYVFLVKKYAEKNWI